MKKLFLIIIIIVSLIPIPITQAVDQMKTEEFFVGDSASQISTQIDKTFSIYIGDDLSGVTNPIKSLYFIVSGVYTGNGTLQLQLDSDVATSKTFTLPNIGSTPTPFEIIYKDDTGKINPSTAGTYSYTLNIIPSGITISGFGAKVNTTHRYVPPSCVDGQPTNEKIKTTNFFVGDSAGQVSTQTDKLFSFYLGDDLSGITNPVKSVYFTVSGVYTSSASSTLQLQLDSDAATSKTFTLPNIGSTPTPFEIIYKDDIGKINPNTSGTYTYTLNIIPANMTISGLGAKATFTHRYKPPTCGGGGMPATGNLISTVLDTGVTDGATYNSIMWKGSLGGGSGKVKFQLATSNNTAGPWNFVGGPTCSAGDWYDAVASNTPIEITCASSYHNNQRYFKYKIQLCSNTDCSTSGSFSPQVDDVVVNWSP